MERPLGDLIGDDDDDDEETNGWDEVLRPATGDRVVRVVVVAIVLVGEVGVAGLKEEVNDADGVVGRGTRKNKKKQ